MGYLDPIKEGQAVAALRESMADMFGDDDELLLDTIEGETSLFEAIDKLLVQIAESNAMTRGLGLEMDDLRARGERFRKRGDAARALIEQAMMLAELDKLERPMGTLSLTRRAPKVEVSEESDIPAEFWKPGDPKLDKKALHAALKEGRPIHGACLSNAAPTLTIRVA